VDGGVLERWLIVAKLSPILPLFVAMMSLFLPLLSAVRPLYYRCFFAAGMGKNRKVSNWLDDNRAGGRNAE
jgi:hypothetical protein